MINVWGRRFLAFHMPSQDDGSTSGGGGRSGPPSLLPPSQGVLPKDTGIRTLGGHEGPGTGRVCRQKEVASDLVLPPAAASSIHLLLAADSTSWQPGH